MNLPLPKGNFQISVPVGTHNIFVRGRHIPHAETILFLHGLACSSDSFTSLLGNNCFPGYSLLAPDLPGFGQSAKPEDFNYSMQGQAALIEQMLSLFPFVRYHIAAHSMGGAIALLFSDHFFHATLSFANLEGNLIADDCGLLSRGIAAHTPDEYRSHIYTEQVQAFAGHSQLRFNQASPEAIHKSAVSLVHWSGSGRLLQRFRALPVPKLYVYGDENREMPVLQHLTFTETVMIPKAGHGMTTDNPAACHAALKYFVVRHSRA